MNVTGSDDARGASSPDADRQGASSADAGPAGASFAAADGREVAFVDADLRVAEFRTTDLRGASFRNADLRGAEFRVADLRGARFRACELSGVVMRAMEVSGADIDAPWLPDGTFFVNGVDVVPLVEAELDRRFPGRAARRAPDPDGLRAAWSALERAWDATLARAAVLPPGTVEVSVAGEWSLAQTLRHLIMATDTWLGRAVLRLERPYHPLGLADAAAEADGLDLSLFTPDHPSYAAVLDARADRVAQVRDFLGTVTPDLLAEPRANPWSPTRAETVLSSLHVILEEEWEHHRFAVRDLTAIEA